MLALRQFRGTAAGVPDLLNWAALIDNGIVLNKDGSVLAGYWYRGDDTESASPDERNYIVSRVNAALGRLGSGWVSWHEAIRSSTAAYPPPEASHFPDPVSRLVDAERRALFLAEGGHHESEYALIVQFTPPLRRQNRIGELVYGEAGDTSRAGDRALAQFRRALDDFEDTIGGVIKLRRMGGYTVTDAAGRKHHQDDLVNTLHFMLTGEAQGLNIPPGGMYLDAVIGGQDLWPGDTPKIGSRYVACVAIEGFPAESWPNMLEILDQLPLSYR